MSIHNTTKDHVGKAFGLVGTPNPFSPNDFAEVLELQRRFMAWLITAIQTRNLLHTSDTKTIADVSITTMMRLRLRQLRN